jgi:replicative DNA helicase
MGELQQIGGRYYLIELLDGVVSTGHVAAHAKIVIEKSALRMLINASNDIVKECYDQAEDTSQILEMAERNIAFIYENQFKNKSSQWVVTANDCLPDILSNLQKQKDGEIEPGLPTHLERFNKAIQFKPGCLYIIAARPSEGKSALLLNFSEHIAQRMMRPVLLFSLEMSKEELFTRALLSHARVPSEVFLADNKLLIDWPGIIRASEYLAQFNNNLMICDASRLTPSQIRAIAKQENKRHPFAFIGIDYLQLVTPDSNKKNSNREQDVASMTRAFKHLSKELNVPIVVCSQLSRENEKQDRRPRLSDLRESGAIEQDADGVIFIYHVKGKPPDDEIKESRLIIAKNRGGPKGNIRVKFMAEYTRFENLDEGE